MWHENSQRRKNKYTHSRRGSVRRNDLVEILESRLLLSGTTTWIGTPGVAADFCAASNWSNGLPSDTVTAVFSTDATVNFSDNITVDGLQVDTGTVSFDLGGKTLSVLADSADSILVAGGSGTAVLTLSSSSAGGKVTTTGNISIASGTGASGRLTLSGAGIELAPGGDLYIGGGSGARGTLEVAGGALTGAAAFKVGTALIGGVEQHGGSGTVLVSAGSASGSDATVQGADINHPSAIAVTGAGASLTLTNMVDNGGTLVNQAQVSVASFGSLNVSSGGTIDMPYLELGNSGNSAGETPQIVFSNGGNWLNAVTIKDDQKKDSTTSGPGRVIVDGPTQKITLKYWDMYGDMVNKANVYNITIKNKAQVVVQTTMRMALVGTVNFEVLSGAYVLVKQSASVGDRYGMRSGDGTLKVSDDQSLFTVLGELAICDGGNGTLNILDKGSVHSMTGLVSSISALQASVATVLVDDGTWLLVDDLGADHTGPQLTIGYEGRSVDLTVKETKNKDTRIEVKGDIFKDKKAKVAGNATLKGHQITAGGKFADFAPGTDEQPIATLTLESTDQADLNMTYDADLGPSGTSDLLLVQGSAQLAGELIVTLASGVSASSLAPHTVFTLLKADSLTGQFDGLANGYYRGGYSYQRDNGDGTTTTVQLLPDLDPDKVWLVNYGQKTLTLTVVNAVEQLSPNLATHFRQLMPNDKQAMMLGGAYSTLMAEGPDYDWDQWLYLGHGGEGGWPAHDDPVGTPIHAQSVAYYGSTVHTTMTYDPAAPHDYYEGRLVSEYYLSGGNLDNPYSQGQYSLPPMTDVLIRLSSFSAGTSTLANITINGVGIVDADGNPLTVSASGSEVVLWRISGMQLLDANGRFNFAADVTLQAPADGCYPPWFQVFVGSLDVPAAAQDLVATASGSSVQLDWTDGPDQGDGVVIEASTDRVTWTAVDEVDAATHTYTSTAGLAMFYRVQTYHLVNGEKVYAPPSNTVNASLSDQGQLTLPGTSGDDAAAVTVDTTDPSMIDISVGGSQILQLPASSFHGLSFDGGDGNDTLSISVPAGQDLEVDFAGGAGTNTLTLSGGAFSLGTDLGIGTSLVVAADTQVSLEVEQNFDNLTINTGAVVYANANLSLLNLSIPGVELGTAPTVGCGQLVLGWGDPLGFGGGTVMLRIYAGGRDPSAVVDRAAQEQTWWMMMLGFYQQNLGYGGITTSVDLNRDKNGLGLFSWTAANDADIGGPGAACIGVMGDILGDTAPDFSVDGADLGILLAHYMTTPGTLPGEEGLTIYTAQEGDWNGDGAVDGADLAILLNNYLQNYTP